MENVDDDAEDWLMPRACPPATHGFGGTGRDARAVIAEMENAQRGVGLAFAELQSTWAEPDRFQPSIHYTEESRREFAWEMTKMLRATHDWMRDARRCAILWQRGEESLSSAVRTRCKAPKPLTPGEGHNGDNFANAHNDAGALLCSSVVRASSDAQRALQIRILVFERRLYVRCAAIKDRIAEALPMPRTYDELRDADELLAFKAALVGARSNKTLGAFVAEVAGVLD